MESFPCNKLNCCSTSVNCLGWDTTPLSPSASATCLSLSDKVFANTRSLYNAEPGVFVSPPSPAPPAPAPPPPGVGSSSGQWTCLEAAVARAAPSPGASCCCCFCVSNPPPVCAVHVLVLYVTQYFLHNSIRISCHTTTIHKQQCATVLLLFIPTMFIPTTYHVHPYRVSYHVCHHPHCCLCPLALHSQSPQQ